jgi:hypothetical protein
MTFKLLLCASSLCIASPALADEYLNFQSPTGNIHCTIETFERTVSARCDLRELTKSYTKRPEGCEYDWGTSFAVDGVGKGYLACISDSMIDGRNPVLTYGEAVSLGGISCVSAKTGVTCTNAAGHGFSVAKGKQKLF